MHVVLVKLSNLVWTTALIDVKNVPEKKLINVKT